MVSKMSDKTVLRLLDSAKQQQDEKKAKEEAYKKRAKAKSDFYSKARINAKLVEKLKEALLTSAIVDENGEALIQWTEELIREIEDSIEDDGPVNKKHK